MKKLCEWIVGLIVGFGVQAQVSAREPVSAREQVERQAPIFSEGAGVGIDTIGVIPLQVADRYTTNLIFPAPIFNADIGSGDVIARKVGKTQNVLLLKAARKGIAPTNVSVYLTDGRLYSFAVEYSDSLRAFNYSFGSSKIQFSSVSDDRGQLEANAVAVTSSPGFLHISKASGGIRLRLKGIYCKDDLLWLGFKIGNKTAFNFTGRLWHCTVVDKHRWRQRAVQSIEIPPVYSGETALAAGGVAVFAAAFKPFPVTRGKRVVLDWGDENGRRVQLVIKGKKILRARLWRS